MEHSRAAARAAKESQDAEKRWRRRRRIWLIVTLLLIIVLAAIAWLAFRALTVKNELEAAQREVSAIQSGGDLSAALSSLGEHSAAAAGAAGDPVWRVAEFVPVAGDNLRAVRLAAESLDLLSNGVGLPIFASDAEGSLLERSLPVLDAAAPRVQALALQVEDVARSGSLIGPVRKGIDQVAEVIVPAGPVLSLLPDLLGVDGARSYLMVFQNNAESVGLGGSAASQTLLRADRGSLTIEGQASSASFDNGRAVDVEVDDSAIELYSDYLVRYVNTSVSRPDFPTAAQILAAFWQRDITDVPIDGVVSVDPLALQRVLKATGPITVGDVTIDEGNAVQILLSDVYHWWDSYKQGDVVDAFFAGVAQSVFERVASGDFNLKDMGWAVSESISRGDILVWSADPQIQDDLSSYRVAGVLPRSNTAETAVGVYFRDTSASKIDYYMDSRIDLGRTCEANESIFAATATLYLDLEQSVADSLPDYVKSRSWGSTKFRTEVFVYGPPGTSFQDASVEGRDVRPLRTDVEDLGRPVAMFEVFLAPGEAATVDASFTGSGEFGPLQLWSTPMVRGTEVSISDGCA